MPAYDASQYGFDANGFMRMKKDLNYIMRHLDHSNVKRLYTEYCEIKSEHGETAIDGPELVMKKNGSTTVRLKMGYNPASSEFEFNLYNAAGVKTIYLDSSGEAVFSGNIQTDKNAYIGTNLYIGSTSEVATRYMMMYSGTGFSYYGMDSSGDMLIYSNGKGLYVTAAKSIGILSLNEGVGIYGQTFFDIKTYSSDSADSAIIEHRGSSDFIIKHSGSGDLALGQAGTGNIRLESVNGNIYIESDTGVTFINYYAHETVLMTTNSFVGNNVSSGTIASQGWVSTNYSPLGHTHSYASQSDINDAIDAHVAAYHTP